MKLHLFCVAILAVLATHAHAAEHAWDTDLGGVASVYTSALVALLRAELKGESTVKIPAAASATADAGPISLRCWETPGNDLYIGVEQRMTVAAPLDKVAAVLDDIDRYQELFPGFKNVHVESRDQNRLLTYWEQHVPIFFVPNVKYEMNYLIDGSAPTRRLYRYQLAKRSDLKASDGFILLTKAPDGPGGEKRTQYLEYDFFDAEWGAAKVLGNSKLWHDAVEGIEQSDLAVKLKSENPAWSNEKSRDESTKLSSADRLRRCWEGRKPFSAAP